MKAIRDSLLQGTLERLGHWGEFSYLGIHTTDKMCQIYDGESAFLAEAVIIRALSFVQVCIVEYCSTG
jgi:hypothetical protein